MRKILLLFIFLLLSCNQGTMSDVYKEYITKQESGVIIKIEKYRGKGYLLKLQSEKKNSSFGVNSIIGEKCKVDDYFVKIKNSNKCQLIRNDSIICMDCLDIEIEERTLLGKFEEWKEVEKDKWKKI